MSISSVEYDDMNDECSFEYNPCIRKGKHKIVHKKQKKYEAKVQKMNLIRTKRHKAIYNDGVLILLDSSALNDLITILKDNDTSRWNETHEHLYTNVYKLYEDETYKTQLRRY